MITEITSLINLCKSLIAMLKQTEGLLPTQEDRQLLTEQVQEAEKQLSLAEIETAKSLGYEICLCDYPPQIMLSTGNEGQFKCGKCGVLKNIATKARTVRIKNKWDAL